MWIKSVTFFEVRLPTVRLAASVGLGGPHLIAWDRQGEHAGGVPLGGGIRIEKPEGETAPWWVCRDHEKRIALAWCDIAMVRDVARTFGIVGDGMGVNRYFYDSPAWAALVDLVAADPQAALQWQDQDGYCPGWFRGAVHDIQRATKPR